MHKSGNRKLRPCIQLVRLIPIRKSVQQCPIPNQVNLHHYIPACCMGLPDYDHGKGRCESKHRGFTANGSEY